MQNSFIKINKKSIYYKFINKNLLSDDKTLLVFLHEGLGCSEQWKDFHEIISEKLQMPALVYDRYGYGKSEEVSGARNPDFLEKEAKVFLPGIFEKLNISEQKKVLFGHSDGGTIAIIHTSIFPENIIGIITEAAHVFIDEITESGLKNTVKFFKTTDLKEKLEKYHGNKTESMFKTWTDVWLSAEMSGWNIEHYLPGIKCPFLAIQGKNDNYGSYRQLESIKNQTSGKTKILFIPDCGHVPHHQAREIVTEEVVRFVRDL